MNEAASTSARGTSAAAPARDRHAPWLALRRVKGLGCVGCKRLLAHFAEPIKIFSASRLELEQVEDLRADAVDGILRFNEWAEVDDELARVRAAGVTLVGFNDEKYPARLRAIADPPPLLYLKGELTAADDKAVAIVGSRSASDYGRRVTRDLARGLAKVGFTVVSGMARGIDGTAHETTLNNGGRTIAVLGSGVERAYPPEHDKLYQRISDGGAVISELPLGTKPLAFNFPARNRLISGLSLGVVVVEATEKSGSLITASMAVEQGREVFALPGEVGSSRSRGAHRLIRQGAKLVENVDDILEEIAPQLLPASGARHAAPLALPQNTGAEARKIFALLQDGQLQVDQVIEKSGLAVAQVLQILLELELQGYVRQLPGQKYVAERAN
ncbi:MAG: DNA-protecting protein DprA [Deltaproteobacteria bacterium]|nr:DNA-protecting protein DprA [Deltaproteobacteria bacterium]